MAEISMTSIFRFASLILYNERPWAKYSPGQTTPSVIRCLYSSMISIANVNKNNLKMLVYPIPCNYQGQQTLTPVAICFSHQIKHLDFKGLGEHDVLKRDYCKILFKGKNVSKRGLWYKGFSFCSFSFFFVRKNKM